MAARTDITNQLASYKGILRWNAYTDGLGASRPGVDVELYIKDHPIPSRKPKTTEIVTALTTDPYSGREAHSEYLFFGGPDVLQITISGFIITPVTRINLGTATAPIWTNTGWDPKTVTGTSLGIGSMPYGEVVSAFLEGRMHPAAIGSGGQRKDPDAYISPYGNEYPKPIIATWECSFTPTMGKQTFNAQLILEK